mgnify:CR=1 FL=1
MDKQTHRLSDLIPGDLSFLEGEYQIDALFEIQCTEAAVLGDVFRAGVSLTSAFGNADYTMLGTDHCFVEWGAYDLRGGASVSARMRRSYVSLHFQLEGTVHLEQPMASLPMPLRAGDTNLSFVPPFAGTFDLNDRSRGSAFSIVLSPAYFEGLATRYPKLLGTYYNRMLRDEPFCLRDRHLRITPEMWGVIQRIQRRDPGQHAGSLFLEAQILELLALQFAQLDQPVQEDGISLSSSDKERIHAARDVLLRRLTDPPTLAELAELVGTNEYKLKRGFKALFGNSPYAYLLEHKLELARAYLLDTDWTVAEIAYHVGYSDPAHLTHAFRKQYGVPPSEMR